MTYSIMIPFFSIIIPIYNGLSHGLPQCLDSIWNQPVDGSIYEVICIDDCSTDESRHWLRKQTMAHDNLRLIFNDENLRQGGSRNRGIKAACGKYIVFIDQDDYYHHDAIARIYEHLNNSDLEILIVDCAYQYFGKESNKLQHNFPHREVMTGDEIIAYNSVPYAPWKFIIQKSLIVENNLFFIEHERIEDVDWVHKVTHYAKRVQYQPILFIHYNKTDVSTTMTSYKSPETMYSALRLASRLEKLSMTVFAESEDMVRQYMFALTERFFYLAIRNMFLCPDKVSVKIESIKKYLHESLCEKKRAPLTRTAYTLPVLYAYTSNFVSHIMPYLLPFYRQCKYRHGQLL